VQPFRVSINAKGGDCWHVYRKSVLVIDGKNTKPRERRRGKSSEEIAVSKSANEVQETNSQEEKRSKTREHLEYHPIQRDQKLRKKSGSGRWIIDPKDQQSSD
jgi:hypothetical protein